MALRLLQGLIRRPTSKTDGVAADHDDGGHACDFSMTESRTGAGAVCLMLSGDIDLTCRDFLRNRLVDMIDIDHVGHLVVDLDEVTFLDCSGIGALIAGHKAALAAECSFELRNARGIVRTILQICEVDELLPIGPTTPPEAEPFAA